MPNMLNEVTLHAATERGLKDLGPTVPADDASRSALIQSVTASFCRDYVGALVEKRVDVKTGRRIKDAFTSLQQQLKAVQPFDEAAFPDATCWRRSRTARATTSPSPSRRSSSSSTC